MSTAEPDERSGEEPAEREWTGLQSREINVGRWERVVSAGVGAVLLVRGLRRQSIRGVLMTVVGGALLSRGVSGQSILYRVVGVIRSESDNREPGATADATEFEQSITVAGEAEDLADYWRDPDRLDQVVGHFATVRPVDEERRHWQVEGPLGRTVSWQSRIVEERPGELLRWESTAGASLPNEWSVRFEPAPADRGTEVTLRVRFDPPGGRLGGMALERFGLVPRTMVGKALHRFKSLAETGEVPTLEGNPSGRGRGDLL
ncbi:SRPBCC family protein [Halobacterium wangiae]|uniref:SRPBCC family protein n=1 Tax=Halobacterium wangiae TaxID=2902623 RepID=UPI001E5CBB81|nr:YgaP-like transmembrane domain [Halobacterium wangiae]